MVVLHGNVKNSELAFSISLIFFRASAKVEVAEPPPKKGEITP